MSTNTKHTPGPWFYRESERLVWTKQDHCAEGLLNNLHIAHICKQDGETKANARLIAAAPDLLEALEYTCNLLDRLPRISDADRIDAPGEAASVLKSARAAIAKATGQNK